MTDYADELQAQDQERLIEPFDKCANCGFSYWAHEEDGTGACHSFLQSREEMES